MAFLWKYAEQHLMTLPQRLFPLNLKSTADTKGDKAMGLLRKMGSHFLPEFFLSISTVCTADPTGAHSPGPAAVP